MRYENFLLKAIKSKVMTLKEMNPLKIFFFAGTMILSAGTLKAQEKIGGAPGPSDPNAYLQLGDNIATKGLLMPRVSLTSTTSPSPMSAMVEGMTVYNKATAGTAPNNVTPGYYYNDGTKWVRVGTTSVAVANLSGAKTGGTSNLVNIVNGTGATMTNAVVQIDTMELGKTINNLINPGTIINGKNVTAGSNKVTLGGTPTGAALKPYSIDVNEANLTLNNIGGTLNLNKINNGGATNNQTLVWNSTLNQWAPGNPATDGDAWGVNGEDATSNISRTGKVGIGTAPAAKLDILAAGGTDSAVIKLRQSGAPAYGMEMGIDNAVHGGLMIRTDNNGTKATAMAIRRDNGNVGIGTTAPAAKLDVVGTTRLSSANGTLDSWFPFTNGNSYITGNEVILRTSNSGDNLHILNNGNVGIGTAAPAAKLDVNGQVKISGGAPGAGKVLTSDATGLAAWQAGGNVTPGSNKVTLGGTPTGAALKPFSVDVNQANMRLDSIGGQLNLTQIKNGGATNNQTLVWNSTTNQWVPGTPASDGDAWGVNGEDQASEIKRSGKVRVGAANTGSVDILSGSATQAGHLGIYKGNGTTRLAYLGHDNNNMTYVAENGATHIFKGGNVGIGVGTVPTEKLSLVSSGEPAGVSIGFSTNAGATPSQARLRVEDNDWSGNMLFETTVPGAGTNPLVERMRINANGNVGIGTNAPSAKLEVNGQVKITGGSPGANKVLTSDANGLASWQPAAATADGDAWGVNGEDQNGTISRMGSVAIGGAGNTGPFKLSVYGDAIINDITIGKGASTSTAYTANTALGGASLQDNTTGTGNTAVGSITLQNNTTGKDNTAVGAGALATTGTGQNNTGIGASALTAATGMNNTALGASAMMAATTASDNVAIGYQAMNGVVTGTNNIAIGANSVSSSLSASNEVTLGNQLNNTYRMYASSWTNVSDRSFKHDIADLPVGLDFVMKLHPVKYVYNNAKNNAASLGFIAQEVKSVVDQYGSIATSNLVETIDSQGHLGLRTTDLIAVLTKAIQEQQVKIKSNEAAIEELKTEIRSLKTQLQK
jgi:hypothetical protein